MKLIDLVLKEYIAIVEHFEKTETVTNNRIIIDKIIFKNLLEKYGYLKFSEKIKIYKALNFIIHDKKTYTLTVWNNGKNIRKVALNYYTYQQVKKLYETEI